MKRTQGPVERYISHILANISDLKFPTTLPQQPNFSSSQRSALRSLRTNPSILILNADKGNSTVVLDKTDYLAEADRQLSDRSTYQPLSQDPTSTFNADLSNFLTTAGLSQGLSKDYLSLLLHHKPRTPSLYFLPKVHKPNNPGRPIVASFSSSTEHVSAYIDAHLQPIIKSLPSYIKDTQHFLEII